jgi:hypothetical protein
MISRSTRSANNPGCHPTGDRVASSLTSNILSHVNFAGRVTELWHCQAQTWATKERRRDRKTAKDTQEARKTKEKLVGRSWHRFCPYGDELCADTNLEHTAIRHGGQREKTSAEQHSEQHSKHYEREQYRGKLSRSQYLCGSLQQQWHECYGHLVRTCCSAHAVFDCV